MASPISPDVASPSVSVSEAPSRFKFTIMKAQGLPRKPLLHHGNFYVSVRVDEEVWKTQSVGERRNAVHWNETFEFNGQRSSSLKLEIYNSHRIRPDKCIGSFQETFSSMLASNSKVISRVIRATEARLNQEAQPIYVDLVLEDVTEPPTRVENPVAQLNQAELTLPIDPVAESVTDSLQPLDEVEGAVQKAKDDVGQMKSLGGGSSLAENADQIESVGEGAVQAVGVWEPLFKNLKMFSELMDGISEIHPYAKMAWSVISVIPKVLRAQLEHDTDIKGLLDIMGDVLSFVHDAGALEKAVSQKSIVALMAQQTTECAYFLQKYAKDKNFFKRTVKNIASDATQRIQEYKAKFLELDNAFKLNAALQTQITVVRVAEAVEGLDIKISLNDMPYAHGARFETGKMCLPGTRTEILDRITHWINNERSDEARVFFLTGGAGTGKSAIAHTIAGRFSDLHRLGSSFICDRSDIANRSSTKLFSTMARDLAHHYVQVGNMLADTEPSLRNTRDIKDQYENLIVKPTTGLSTVGPVLIVIDALDEIGTVKERHRVIELLANEAKKLPPDFCILVTSRPGQDILANFERAPGVVHYRMDNVPDTRQDIMMYICAQLNNQDGQPSEGFDDTMYSMLADKSEDLFQWAFVACDAIKEQTIGASPLDTYIDLIASPTGDKGRLDDLYIQILSGLFEKRNLKAIPQFKDALGWVLTSFKPLPIVALHQLCMQDQISSILKHMGSLLSGVTGDPHIPVQPLHTSFRDFLTDPQRSDQFYINTSDYHQGLCLGSLCMMNISLQFNICKLTTSYLRNMDVPGLELSVRDNISPALSYSCQFWGEHLEAIPYNDEVHVAAKSFMYKSLLFWFEALSLLKKVNVARQALLSLVEWSKGYDEGLTEFGKDAVKLIAYFAGPIAESAPHTYLSVISWAPKRCIVTSHYKSQFPHILTVVKGRQNDWPAIQRLLEGHEDHVRSVAFSPNGKQIVSGSFDKTIRVWDVETGDQVLAPFVGHDTAVLSVAFSPNGKHIVSGSDDKTIRVWDVETGDQVLAPFEGHDGAVESVAFSPNGKHIVFGSYDKTIRVWDVETGDQVLAPFVGHDTAVLSVAFSPNGKQIVSGSDDKTIRVWDVETGDQVLAPFVGHDRAVLSVAFSPNGKQIISGSDDKTIRVWDVETGDQVLAPFVGHEDLVRSVAFSPNGKHIISGSDDKTIRVWDVETGDQVLAPFVGHDRAVESVAFSPNGKQIVSGSNDSTIRVWDVETQDVILGSLLRYRDIAKSLCLVQSEDAIFTADRSQYQTLISM